MTDDNSNINLDAEALGGWGTEQTTEETCKALRQMSRLLSDYADATEQAATESGVPVDLASLVAVATLASSVGEGMRVALARHRVMVSAAREHHEQQEQGHKTN